VFEFFSPLTILLLMNSFLTIGFIFNQNETTKDSMTPQSSSSLRNPLEILTWGCLFVQLFLLLIKIKILEI
jgi:hypothetical protein